MQVKRILSGAFSPVGHTERVVGALKSAWSATPELDVDLSRRDLDCSSLPFEESDLFLCGVPVYGGRVPPPAAERISRMRGGGALAVVVVSYGARAFDDALLELKNLLDGSGFRTIAGVAAVAEHTMAPRIASGRPSAADEAELKVFGSRIREAVAGMESPNGVSLPGSLPYRAFGGLPFHTVASRKCVRCRLCAERCPVGAIPPETPNATKKDRCIVCMRCVAVCPNGARSLPLFVRWLAARKLRRICSDAKRNELFL